MCRAVVSTDAWPTLRMCVRALELGGRRREGHRERSQGIGSQGNTGRKRTKEEDGGRLQRVRGRVATSAIKALSEGDWSPWGRRRRGEHAGHARVSERDEHEPCPSKTTLWTRSEHAKTVVTTVTGKEVMQEAAASCLVMSPLII